MEEVTRKLGDCYHLVLGLPWWLSSKEPACNAADAGSVPKSGRFPGEGNGTPLQYSCLENPMDRGAWRAYSPWGRKRVRHDLVTKQTNKRQGMAR